LSLVNREEPLSCSLFALVVCPQLPQYNFALPPMLTTCLIVLHFGQLSGCGGGGWFFVGLKEIFSESTGIVVSPIFLSDKVLA